MNKKKYLIIITIIIIVIIILLLMWYLLVNKINDNQKIQNKVIEVSKEIIENNEKGQKDTIDVSKEIVGEVLEVIEQIEEIEEIEEIAVEIETDEKIEEVIENDENTTEEQYFVFDKETGTITDYSDNGPSKIVIPKFIGGVKVKNIRDFAFNNKGIKEIIIPSTIENISYCAFSFKDLDSIVNYDGTIAEDYVYVPFEGGISIIKYVGNNTNIVIPESINGKDVLKIGKYVGSRFKKITIPKTIKEIEAEAFGYSEVLEEVINYDGEISNEYIYYNTDDGIVINRYFGKSKWVSIPSQILGKNVFKIGDYAFRGAGLTTIRIPYEIKVIGNNAFYDNKIQYVSIPPQIEDIGTNAFSVNNMVGLINYDGLVSEEYIYLPTNGGIKIVGYIGASDIDLEIPNEINGNTIVEISDMVFSDNKLQGLKLPNGLKKIGNYAFHGGKVAQANNIKTLELPNGLESIGNYAFTRNKITNLKIPDSLTEIGDYAFYDNRITNLELGNSIKKIGKEAFVYNQITDLKIPKSLTEIGDAAFSYNYLVNLSLYDGMTKIGKNAFSFNYITDLKIPDSIIEIGDYAFYGNKGPFKTLELGNGVEIIGDHAFGTYQKSSNSITNLKIPDSVIKIGAYSFYGCYIVNLTLSNRLVEIGDYAFYNNSISSLKLPNSIKIIGNYVFQSDYSTVITDLEVPDSIEKIGDYAFMQSNFTNLELPNTITEIGNYAFINSKITNLKLPDKLEKIGDYAFQNNNIINLKIPDSIIEIGQGAFSLNKIEEIEFGTNLKFINSYAFDNNKIENLILPEGLEVISCKSFQNNVLKYIEMPSNIKYAHISSFDGNDKIEKVINYDGIESQDYIYIPTTNEGEDGIFIIKDLGDGVNINTPTQINGKNVFYEIHKNNGNDWEKWVEQVVCSY